MIPPIDAEVKMLSEKGGTYEDVHGNIVDIQTLGRKILDNSKIKRGKKSKDDDDDFNENW